jgi:hypothetical protein
VQVNHRTCPSLVTGLGGDGDSAELFIRGRLAPLVPDGVTLWDGTSGSAPPGAVPAQRASSPPLDSRSCGAAGLPSRAGMVLGAAIPSKQRKSTVVTSCMTS